MKNIVDKHYKSGVAKIDIANKLTRSAWNHQLIIEQIASVICSRNDDQRILRQHFYKGGKITTVCYVR